MAKYALISISNKNTMSLCIMDVDNILGQRFMGLIHLKRLESLALRVNTVLQTKRLPVTQLGRSLALAIQEGSGIPRAGRLAGNSKLQGERLGIARRLSHQRIANKQRPGVIIDWRHLPHTPHHVLTVALVGAGRALSWYEEVHTEPAPQTDKVQRQFIPTFASLLPLACRPIGVTDAGFQHKGFEHLRMSGWDYPGRIRHRKL